MKIFLDDNPARAKVVLGPDWDTGDWIIVRTIHQVQNFLRIGVVTDLSLDNDLGTNYAEGHELVLWMAKNNRWPSKTCTVHSGNPVAAKRMSEDIARYFKPQEKEEIHPPKDLVVDTTKKFMDEPSTVMEQSYEDFWRNKGPQ